MKPDGRVKVYIETPDLHYGFRHATCWLPEYRWEDIKGYSKAEWEQLRDIVRNNAHLILEFSQAGGFNSSSI